MFCRGRKSKYGAKKTDGYDSKREASYASCLHILAKRGEIKCLEKQKTFELLPKQVDKNGKCIYRGIKYIADFCFYDKDGNYHVQDVKGFKTKEFSIKEKLFYHKYGVKIEIIK